MARDRSFSRRALGAGRWNLRAWSNNRALVQLPNLRLRSLARVSASIPVSLAKTLSLK